MSTTIAASQSSVGISAQPNIINCWFVVDNSQSMEGEKFTLAKNGVLNCIGQLTNSDFFGILTFASTIDLITSGSKQNTNLNKFHSVRADGGGTALYDAILQAGSLSWALHRQIKSALSGGTSINVITYMILLTDGDDNSSKKTQNDVKIFLRNINQTRDFKIILAGIGLSSRATGIMRDFGSIGDNDIEFRELKSNNDIKQLFEHFTFTIHATRTTVVASARGAVAMLETSQINLGSGATRNNTTLVGVTGGGNNYNNGGRYLTDGTEMLGIIPTQRNHLLSNKPVPTELSNFWDTSYDLNDYELKAYYGVCCFQCCCQCCFLPGTVDHCCLLIPSQTLGNCCTGNCAGGLICSFCGIPFLAMCCPCTYMKMCTICCSGGVTERYDYPTPK